MPEEITYKLKYALLTPEQYANLNTAIGTAKGYSEQTSTQRYAPEHPQMSAQVLDEDENIITQSMCVMPITAQVQEQYPTLVEGIELVDNYTPQIIEDV